MPTIDERCYGHEPAETELLRLCERIKRAETERNEWKEKAEWQAAVTRAFMEQQEDWTKERKALAALLVDMRAADQSMRLWQWAPRIDAALREGK
jgi:hypothetical protein